MADNTHGFSIFKEDNDQVRHWLREREEAILLVRSFGEDLVFEAVARRLSASYQATGELPEHDELPPIVHGLASTLNLDSEGVERLGDREVQSICVSGGLARFLDEKVSDEKRLSAAARVEFFLDVAFLAERLAHGPKSGAWLDQLKKTKLDISTINGDEYVASDAIKEWQKELPRPVPSWRAGDFPHSGLETAELFSALLQSLDEDAWLVFIDRLPLPMMMEALLWATHVERKPERLLHWIERAPLAFDCDEKRTPSALVFVLERRARTFIEDHLTRQLRWGQEEELGKAALKELEGARNELAQALRSRKDATPLLCELAAKYMSMAATGDAYSAQTRQRHNLFSSIGDEYLRLLGSPDEVYALLEKRAQHGNGRSRWTLWLAGASQLLPREDGEPETAAHLLPKYWEWLVELLDSKDPEIAERYAVPAQWTEAAGGVALAGTEDPVAELERVWDVLSSQRLIVLEDRYSKDPWATTRYLIRVGYSAARIASDAQTAVALWNASMQMAISAWFARSTTDPFAEVEFGLGHLARMESGVEDEPRKTFEYMVGLPTEVARAALMLADNGMPPASIESAASRAQINLSEYLVLCNDSRLVERAAELLKAYRPIFTNQ